MERSFRTVYDPHPTQTIILHITTERLSKTAGKLPIADFTVLNPSNRRERHRNVTHLTLPLTIHPVERLMNVESVEVHVGVVKKFGEGDASAGVVLVL
ncbi:hypothetical protein TNCV_3851601 [Trichonephila clavipes]|nr:hypothetical protein TNCV_3851601 [Trichonephila clavipes]